MNPEFITVKSYDGGRSPSNRLLVGTADIRIAGILSLIEEQEGVGGPYYVFLGAGQPCVHVDKEDYDRLREALGLLPRV